AAGRAGPPAPPPPAPPPPPPPAAPPPPPPAPPPPPPPAAPPTAPAVPPTATPSGAARATPSAQAGAPLGCPAALSPPLALGDSGDTYYPHEGNAGYDAQHYTLTLDVNVPTNTLSATATMRALALEDLSAFNLDLHGLTVRAVTLDGAPARYSRKGDELTITAPQPLRQGALFTSTIAYGGVPAALISEAIPISVGWNKTPGGTYV